MNQLINFWLYQLRVPEYFWFDPFNPNDWAGFTLINGSYEPIIADELGRLPSQQLGLKLVKWSGVYKTVETLWLRWATSDGEILPTPDELSAIKAQEAQRQAEQAQQRSQELETLLNRYRQQFGELPESSSDHF